MDNSALNFIQIIVSISLIIIILLQVRGQGTGLFGSAEGSFRTRRGLEKTMFQFTILLIVVFIGISILSVRNF
jgi:preprotein translocase subunit SecG